MHTMSNLRRSSAIAYVPCHRGLGGFAVVGCLEQKGCDGLVTWPHAKLDLTNNTVVVRLFAEEY